MQVKIFNRKTGLSHKRQYVAVKKIHAEYGRVILLLTLYIPASYSDILLSSVDDLCLTFPSSLLQTQISSDLDPNSLTMENNNRPRKKKKK